MTDRIVGGAASVLMETARVEERGAPTLPGIRTLGSVVSTVALALALAAGVLAWLIWQGYRQPELILDFAAMRLC